MSSRPIELDICTSDGVRSVEVIEVALDATLGQMIEVARVYLNVCGWRKVRIGVGGMWSRWITN